MTFSFLCKVERDRENTAGVCCTRTENSKSLPVVFNRIRCFEQSSIPARQVEVTRYDRVSSAKETTSRAEKNKGIQGLRKKRE
ncbi:MAG: hypothetical protein D3904_11260 [Candidatus Electrothrix sp. EH2]|nr:hypothetical protein [Candidatus Electrothrix sp. EH2]